MKLRIRFQCTGCGACAAICPDGALFRLGRRVAVNPDLCRSCASAKIPACAVHCPAGAIEPAAPASGRKSHRRKSVS